MASSPSQMDSVSCSVLVIPHIGITFEGYFSMIYVPQLLIVQEGFHESSKTVISPCIKEYFFNDIIYSIYFHISTAYQNNHNSLSEQLILLLFRGVLSLIHI